MKPSAGINTNYTYTPNTLVLSYLLDLNRRLLCYWVLIKITWSFLFYTTGCWLI